MNDFFALFEGWPYVVWALGAATMFYMATSFAIAHLHPDKKAHLSLWLQGDYESTWSSQFCAMFDSIFGDVHWRPRCILLSAIASVIAVLGLWLLLDQILGLISLRGDTGLSLTQALLLGAAINIIPDYLSLYETRWLLKQFERIRNPLGQLLVLLLDAVITGLIIYLGIQAYLWATGREEIALVQMIALFSFYAIFFYSTFLTSIWAWAYCLSSWVSRLSAGLSGWLDTRHSPGPVLALIGAAIVLAGSLAIRPALEMDEDGRIAVDDLLCDLFPASACVHVARLTKDEEEKLDYLARACIGGVTEECLQTGLSVYQVNPEQAVTLWTKSCDGGDAQGCYNLGVMYDEALGVAQDYARAVELYKQGCDGGHALGCTNLGFMYARALGVAQDYARAVDLYKQGCDGGNALGCTNLGWMHVSGDGVDRDDARAVELFKQSCDGGDVIGCGSLGDMYRRGRGVEIDLAKARELLTRGCDGGSQWSCDRLTLLPPLEADQD